MGLREFYYKMEEKYYAFLDSLDKKGIPVYSVVDPIDKVVPSFVLFLVLFGIIIIAIIYALIVAFGLPMTNQVTVTFSDKMGTPIPNALVSFSLADSNEEMTTDAFGTIKFEAEPGKEIMFSLKYNDKTYVKSVKIEDDVLQYKVSIDQLNLSKQKLSFSLYTTDNTPLQAVDIYFSCSNSSAEAPDNMMGYSTNDVDVDVDGDCGYLMVSTASEFYKPTDDTQIDNGEAIYLDPVQSSGDSAIVVNVTDTTGAIVTDFEATLSIGIYDGYYSSGYSNETSQVQFANLAAGLYKITVSKSGYTNAVGSVTLEETDVKTLNLQMTKLEGGTQVSIKVMNLASKALQGAEVCFYDINGESYTKIGCATTNESGLATYTLEKDKSHKFTVTKEGYSSIVYTDLAANSDTIEVKLSSVDPSKYRLMKVKVIDSEGKPVENAKVNVYDDKGNIAPYEPGTTDLNGMAYLSFIEDGKYKLFAYKLNYSGFSDLADFDNQDNLATIDYTVSMYIPKGIIAVSVVDSYGSNVPNAVVKFFDASWNEITALGGKHTDGYGQLGVEYRADKKLFFVVQKESYENYISKSEYIIPDTTTEKKVVMEKKKLKPEPKVEFVNLTTEDGTDVSILGAGNKYIAKFKITLPEKEQPFETMSAYFVSGDKDIVEKDGWHIEKVVYSGLGTLSKGRSYTGNYDNDIKGINQVGNEIEQGMPFEDSFKWIGINWDLEKMDLISGIFFVDVYLKVKDTTKIGENLPINFKLSTENKDEKFTDPLNEVPEFPDASKTKLYNESKNKFFTVGTAQQTCDELFCFEINVEDNDEAIIQDMVPDTPYVSELGKNYTLRFKLINNNIKPVTNYRVIIKNEQENTFFTTSNIKGVSGNISPVLNSEVAKQENNYQIVYNEDVYQELQKNDLVIGEINFEPRKIGSGSLKFIVIQDKQEYYSKEFLINVNAYKEMTVTLAPEVLPSYIPLKVDLLAKDKETGELVTGAKIYVKDNSGLVLFMGATDAEGKAVIDLPSQKPNVLLKLLVYKPKYKSFEFEYKTSSEFITLSKEKIDMKIDAKLGFAKESLFLTNTSEVPVKIEDIFLQGNFAEKLSLAQINKYFEVSHKGKMVDKSLKYDLAINLALTELGQNITTNEEYDSILVIKLSAMGGKWEMKVPMHLLLSVGGSVDDRTCLAADLINMKLVSTENKQDKQTLTITNGCTINGKPVSLNNLEAKLEWKTNALGSIQMTKEEYSNNVMQAYFTSLINKLTPSSENTFVVNIEPKSKVSGKGEAILHLRALNNTESGVEYIILDIPLEVDVVNYGECIQFELPNAETDVVATLRDADTSFKVTNTCAEKIEVTFSLKPEDTVQISPDKIWVKANETKEIKVKPTNSAIGVYTVDVFGRTEGHTNEGIRVGINALRVLLQPLTTDCFYLENYEFDMARNPEETKWTTLVNKCVNKQAVVQYDLKIEVDVDGWDYVLGILGGAAGGAVGNKLGGMIGELGGGLLGGLGAGNFGMVMLETKDDCELECLYNYSGEEYTTCVNVCASMGLPETEAPSGTTGTGSGAGASGIGGDVSGTPPANGTGTGTGTGDKPAADKKKFDKGSFKEAITGGLGSAAGSAGVSYLIGSLTGLDPETKKDTTKWSAILGGVGGLAGSWIGGPMGMVLGGLGGAVGNIIGLASNDGDTIETITRTIPTMVEDYMTMNDVLLTEAAQKSMLGGNMAALKAKSIADKAGTVAAEIINATSALSGNVVFESGGTIEIELSKKIERTFNNQNKLVKGIGEQAIEMYPVGFTKSKTGMDNKVESLTLLLNYNRKNLKSLVASQDYSTSGWTTQPNQYMSQMGGYGQSGQYGMQNGGYNGYGYGSSMGYGGYGTGMGYSGMDSYGMPSAFSTIGLQADSDTISYEDAQEDQKVEEMDREKVETSLEPGNVEIINEYSPISMLFTDVADQQKKYNLPIENCFLANGKSGATGPEAKPKVAFTWRWNDVVDYQVGSGGYMCSDGNIYCDATQFTIEVINRLKIANGLLKSFSPDCEYSQAIYNDTFDVTDQYVGVSSVVVERLGNSSSNYNLVVKVQNNSLNKLSGNYIVKVVDTQQTKDLYTFNGQFDLSKKSNASDDELVITNEVELYYSTFKVEVQFNSVKNEDTTEKLPYNYVIPYNGEQFAYDSTALMGLEKSTDKIIEWGNCAKKEGAATTIWNKLNFEAYLMKDGFTDDFLADFKEYAVNQKFLDAPGDAKKIINNLLPNNLKFLPKESALNAMGYSLPQAGLYKVEIVVKYGDTHMGWDVFDSDGKIIEDVNSIAVYLEPVKFSDNPLYYLPLDATVGVENYELKRIGYGLDFGGDTLWFNKESEDNPTLIPTLVSKSNPQVHVETVSKQDMETLNTYKGLVLKVVPTGTVGDTVERTIYYYPSVPAPVAMYISKESDGPAYGSYLISRANKGPVNSGNSLMNWYGFCNKGTEMYAPETDTEKKYACKGFSGEDIIDLQGYPDKAGTKIDIPLGEFKANAYGMFFDEDSLLRTPETSKVFFRGIIYLTPNETSTFKKITASDEMKILYPEGASDEFTLEPLNKDVSTVQSIYDLVGDGYMCVTNPQGGAGVEFWWNPKAVFDTLESGDAEGSS
ncbi:MAG: carboxypeptidase-like regulatory domain-containing protein [Candidatus ainarchaeum sp.]|nr:carboxypeptidase-like regulatory domain-containing protein [Candidatus ainarchaeum sp.]